VQDHPEHLSPEAISRFWSWWSSARDRVAHAIDTRSLSEPVVSEISMAVHALNAGFAWELGPGRAARHALTVSPEGDLALRRMTGQWLRSAPTADPIWEFYASRQSSPRPGIEIQGQRFSPEEFRVAYQFDESRERFDIQVYHPRFKKSDDGVVSQVLFLTLDETLGEDDVERWVGEMAPVPSQPRGAKTLEEFIKAIDAARNRASGEQFTLGQGQSRDGHPVVVMVNTALKQIDHLDHVYQLVVVIGLRDTGPNGLPTNAEAEQLNRAEDDLLAGLGRNAIQIGRVTWAGRREIHFFVENPAQAESSVAAWTQTVIPRAATHVLVPDPGWTAAKEGIYAALAPRPTA
jgi:hypothetical protein